MTLNPFKKSEVTEAFRWKESDSRGGKFHDISQMETRHLFFTLRMIWNHRMPEEAKIRPYQEYQFGPFYTDDYFLEAVLRMMPELSKRGDIEPHWLRQLEKMASYLDRQTNLIPTRPTPTRE